MSIDEIFYIFLGIQIFLLYMLFRNFWLMEKLMNYKERKFFPTVHEMMLKFWIWDMEKFKTKV